MKITVIIPTFRPKDYIYECLDSIRLQTLNHDEFEVIIVLNGCDQPWKKKLEKYISSCNNDTAFSLFQVDQGGVSNARNIALDYAQGEYIAFIDDDDFISPNYLFELLQCSSEKCVALSNCIYYDEEARRLIENNIQHRLFQKLHSLPKSSLFSARSYFNGPCMKLLHRDIVGDRRFDCRFSNGEDNLMMYLISDRIESVQFTSHTSIYYRRIRAESATTRKRSRIERILNSCRIIGLYTKYVMHNPFGYNYPFILSRFAAEIKSILCVLKINL